MRPFRAAPGLDGPAGILQGGLATAVPTAAARLADPFGAPLTSVVARLHAPTPLGADLTIALRPGGGVAHHEVQLRHGDTLLVSASVELAGRDQPPAIPDLVELATGPIPELVLHPTYPDCFVCGPGNTHPHAQRCAMGHVNDEAVVLPWLVDDALAEPGPTIDPILVSAVLDCPGVWAATPALTAAGFAGCLLGGMEVRWYRDAPVYEVLRVAARFDELTGRKIRVRTALLDEEGQVYAVASALHIAVNEVPRLS
ncbi:hypothetical protein [Nitriliruptor alkaliphilus]|uniref:hypothetical protein n=1 Tax=Nitriliruptor alkaliphilus TaxID=427918 RepID=UPI00069887A4|nr:hypothetical protein [Nitriliruptor alkaliphilus]